nr:spike protein [Betacoronavirus sp.]
MVSCYRLCLLQLILSAHYTLATYSPQQGYHPTNPYHEGNGGSSNDEGHLSVCNSFTNPVSNLNTVTTLQAYGLISVYYPDRVFRSNSTVVFDNQFPLIGSTLISWPALKAANQVELYNFVRHPFKNGVFISITHSSQYQMASSPPMYLFGTYFNESSYTLAIYATGTTVNIKVCTFHVCKQPYVEVDRVSNQHQGNPLVYDQHALAFYNSCLSVDSYSLNFSRSGTTQNGVNASSITTYVFKYQNGIFEIYHGFEDKPNGISPFPKPFMQIPLSIPISHFIVPPVWPKAPQSVQPGYQRGNYIVNYVNLQKSTLMYEFDDSGQISNFVDCTAGPKEELMCSQNSFNVTPGVYTTTNYRATPRQHVVLHSVDVSKECEFQRLINITERTVPPPAFWRRSYINNCNYDISVFTDNAYVNSLQCYGVSPSHLADMCWESAYVDYMKIVENDIFSFRPNGAGDFAKYNYKIPVDFIGCTVVFTTPELTCNATTGQLCHVYSNNVSDYTNGNHAWQWDKEHFNNTELYEMWSPDKVVDCDLQEVQSQQINPTPFSCYRQPYKSSDYWRPMSFRGLNSLMVAMAITLKPTKTSASVCGYKQKTTELVLDQCVTYQIYGYKGTGVIVRTNYTFLAFQNVQVNPTGTLHAFKYNNTIYGILPCAQALVSVVTAGAEHDNVAVVYTGLSCDKFQTKMRGVSSDGWALYTNVTSPIDTPIGCLTGASSAPQNSTECQFSLGLSTCVNYTVNTRAKRSTNSTTFNYMYFSQELPKVSEEAAVAFDNSTLQIPINFTLAVEYETIPVTMPKVTVDCAQYVCGNNQECKTLLVQYGKFCENINDALRGIALQQDDNQKGVFASVKTMPKTTGQLNLANVNGFNFSSIINNDAINGNNFQTRSAIEDLFFDKVETADVGFMKKYDECTGGSVFKDLECAQSYNGLMVLPPQMTDGHVAAYTTSAALGSFFSIPNTMQMAYRFNGIAVTQKVLMDNQKQIANKFNDAMMAVQKGFTATNSAVQKLQQVVNDNAQALNTLIAQLTNNFGAISNAINDITQRLDKLEADAQIDRLINGRLQVLQTFVTQQLIRASEIRASAKLAAQKMSECVQGQSQRVDFCGNGLHLMSFPQSAPYGMVYLHVLYKPTAYTNVTTVPAICSNGVAYFPVDGVFVYHDGSLMYTKRNFFEPENITIDNIRSAGSCSVDVSYVNHTVYDPPTPELDDFKQELEEIKKNFSSNIPTRPNFTLPGLEGINASMVDLSDEVKALNEVVQQLNASLINLQELGVHSQYIKWPWYVWLGFIAGLVAIVMAAIMLCCMTSCCSCFKGLCSCRRCCDTFDEPDEPIKHHYP